MKYKSGLILIGLNFTHCCLISCSVATKIYYNNTSNIDDGEIWGSNLNLFFVKNDRVKITQNKSNQLKTELKLIRDNLLKSNNVEKNDDYFYDYAFIINSKDTLYANSTFEIWRYRNLKDKVPNKVKSYVKALN